MSSSKRLMLALVAVVVMATLPGCKRDRASTGTPGNPFVLVVSAAHADQASAAALEAALAARSGLTIRVRVAPAGARAVSAVGAPHVDAGVLPLLEYLLARQEYGVEAGLQVIRGSSRVYAGVLVVQEDASMRAISDLAGRKVAFVDQTSTTGFLLPLRALQQAGVAVERSFTGSHDAALAALASGTVEAAATYATPRTGLRVLAETGSVPNEPVFFARQVPAAIRERIERALLDLASTEAGRALLEPIGGISGFAPVTDETYQPVHELLRATQRSLPDLVPGGHQLVNWNKVPMSDLGTL